MSVHDEENTREELRLRHRYLDLRRKRMNDNLRLRAQTIQAARRFLEDAGFIEVETPVLTRSTPEGARDYVLSQPGLRRRMVRPAPVPPVVQTAADGGRHRAVLPGGPLFPRRRPAGRPPAGIHPAGH